VQTEPAPESERPSLAMLARQSLLRERMEQMQKKQAAAAAAATAAPPAAQQQSPPAAAPERTAARVIRDEDLAFSDDDDEETNDEGLFRSRPQSAWGDSHAKTVRPISARPVSARPQPQPGYDTFRLPLTEDDMELQSLLAGVNEDELRDMALFAWNTVEAKKKSAPASARGQLAATPAAQPAQTVQNREPATKAAAATVAAAPTPKRSEIVSARRAIVPVNPFVSDSYGR
jgi:hypothetical protein